MNIPLISGQIAKLHVKLESEDDFELYGGTTKAGFSITPERPESKNEWLVTIDEPEVAGKPLTRFDIYVRQISSGREWVVLSGKLLVSPRSAGVDADKLAPIEYNVTIPVVENAVDLTGAAIVTGIPGPRGWSAYEIAVQNGFVGSEPEWLEHMRQQTATLAVEQVTPLMERAETAADKSEREAAAAKTAQETAAAHAKAAKESEIAAAGHKTAAAGEVTKAAAEVTKAQQARETAAGHAEAAAKSAQDALANQQGAEQAAQDAAQAQAAATAAKTDAEAAKEQAQTAEGNATASANAAAADKAAADKAKQDALAAQTKAQQEAAIATKAAADAQAPESIAAQSARPATMLLVKDELMSILGDASLFDLDTDGQKIIVHTDRLSDELLATVTDMLERFVPPFIEVVQYNHNMEVSWRDINKYAECTSKADMLAVNPDYINDLTSDGSWVYPLPGMVDVREPVFTGSPMKHFRGSLPNLKVAGEGYIGGLLQGLNLISFECELPVLEQEAYSFIDSRSMKEWNIELPMLRSVFQMFRWSSMTEWHIELPNLKKGHCMFGNSKMEDFKVGLPSLSDGSYVFESCQINKESALRVLNSIPAYTSGKHPLHIGIHVDHQADEEVLAAIDAATVKGWTVQVQWNGKATASTFALRPAPPMPVYAKVDTFTDEEGNEQRSLNWCHQVSSPDGKEPEALSYTMFESVEEARAHFNLPEPEEMPEEILTSE